MSDVDSLLHTKIRVPALRKGLIHRKQLLELMDSGLLKRLTLVSAPAAVLALASQNLQVGLS